MKRSKVLSELRKEASNSGSQDIQEVLKLGKTYWFRGCPLQSGDEVIALRLDNGVKIELDENDIIDIRKEDGFYMVQVKDGTNALASFDMLTKVDSSAQACECASTDKDGSEKQMMASSSIDVGFEDIFRPPMLGVYICYNEPYFTMRCYRYQDKCGKWHTFCIPDIGFRPVCRWI